MNKSTNSLENLYNKKEKISNQTIIFKNKPHIIGHYSLVGVKEGKGPFKRYFDYILKDDDFGEKTFEKAELKLLEKIAFTCLEKYKINADDIDVFLSGDLLNQIISSSFTARKLKIPFLGLFGACSTMTESLCIGACLIDGGHVKKALCSTCSHFATSERQFRFPLELGTQKPPTGQWTVTGGGATILSINNNDNTPYISAITLGKVVDYGYSDVNNMGAAMAPAAMDTLVAHFKNTKTNPSDYDLILTGDLGKLGSEILLDLMEKAGYPLGVNYGDCGHMMFDKDQRTYMGGSGCGCSASILNSFVLKAMEKHVFKNILFMSTGALMSTTSSQQGESIPGIAHLVNIKIDDNNNH